MPLRQVLGPILFNFLIFCNYAVWVVLPLYAERKFDATAETTATLLLVITVVHLVAAVPAGRLIQRFGSSNVLTAGLLVAIAGTLGIVAAPDTAWTVVPLILYGSGMVAAVNSAGDIVLQRGGGGSRAVGALRLCSDLGLVIGPFLAGTLADAYGYGAPFVVFPIMMGCAAAARLLIPERMRLSGGIRHEGWTVRRYPRKPGGL
jgi:MFS family permease